MTAPSWYGEDHGIDLSDRVAGPAVGSVIEWRTWCGPTRATVVSYGQGIYGATGVSLRSSDGHVESHPSGLPRGWQLVTTPTIDATHAATVERHKLSPCQLEVSDWPYDCESKRRHPDHVVTVCRAHGAWWHA